MADEKPEYIPEVDRWRCRLCNRIYVVAILARDCEVKCLRNAGSS